MNILNEYIDHHTYTVTANIDDDDDDDVRRVSWLSAASSSMPLRIPDLDCLMLSPETVLLATVVASRAATGPLRQHHTTSHPTHTHTPPHRKPQASQIGRPRTTATGPATSVLLCKIMSKQSDMFFLGRRNARTHSRKVVWLLAQGRARSVLIRCLMLFHASCFMFDVN